MARVILWASLALVLSAPAAWAQEPATPTPPAGESPDSKVLREFNAIKDNPRSYVVMIEVMVLLSILTLAPSIIVMVTSFTRIVIVLSFLRRALSTQELPPNQIVIALALILSVMVMMPTLEAIKRDALDPYTRAVDPIPQKEAIARTVNHLRGFMFLHTRSKDIRLFMDATGELQRVGKPLTKDKVPTSVLVPAFVISELRMAFIMGFALFLPFLVIDMVVSAMLISMGMLVLPPILISLPFKILLFILVDGWSLIVESLVRSFEYT